MAQSRPPTRVDRCNPARRIRAGALNERLRRRRSSWRRRSAVPGMPSRGDLDWRSAYAARRRVPARVDGRSLYDVSYGNNAVIGFKTKPLTLAECFTGIAHPRPFGSRPCHLLPHAGTEDTSNGFDGAFFAAISHDGRSLYTVSDDNSIGIFSRARSGELSYHGCITGDISAFGTGRRGICKPIPTATKDEFATFSGLSLPASLVVSSGGRFVYAALRGEQGIATLARAADGSLRFVRCLRGAIPKAVRVGLVRDERAPICPLVAPEGENSSGSGLRGELAGCQPTADRSTQVRRGRSPSSVWIGRLALSVSAAALTQPSAAAAPAIPAR
jgi:hypothetical protein